MPARIKWDTIAPFQLDDTDQNGIFLVRGLQVCDIPISAGISDPEIALKCLAIPGFPQRNDLYPSSTLSARLYRRRATSIDRQRDIINWEIYYRTEGDFDPLNVPTYTIEDLTYVENQTTLATADESAPLRVVYQAGYQTLRLPDSDVIPILGLGGHSLTVKGVGVSKTHGRRAIRVSATVSGTYWKQVRKNFRAIKSNINKKFWGTEPPFTWLYMGPNARTSDKGRTYRLEMDFINDEKGHFPVCAYFDQFGNHPADSTPEKALRLDLYPPVYGKVICGNGISIASVYKDVDFNDYFLFNPNSV